MIADTYYTVSFDLIQEALIQMPEFIDRLDLTQQTGDFFYDKWELRSEFTGSVWKQILDTLPLNFGQARIMKLEPGRAYYSHADMDDRYHLNLSGDKAYLINLDTNEMFPTILDSKWYEMDAGKRHSAVNFGGVTRLQLVVRKLLTPGMIQEPILVEIGIVQSMHNFRYVFDDVYSPWLNRKNKQGKIKNFKIISEDRVSFITEKDLVKELESICPTGFEIRYER